MSFFRNKVFIITGASSGIGKALAHHAYEQGACIAVCARDAEKLDHAYEGLDEARVLKSYADVSKEEDCRQFILSVEQKWGKADVLINNAGISMRALFREAGISVIRELMDINFWGAVYCCKFALPMLLQSKGVIVGVSSIAGYRGLPARTGYSSSKFALQGFLEALRTEMIETGVHVMWVSPGFTATNIRNVARSADGSIQKETPLNENELMSAEACAGIIMNGIEKRKRTIVMTLQGKLVVWLNKLWPSFVDKLVYRHFLNESGSPLKK